MLAERRRRRRRRREEEGGGRNYLLDVQRCLDLGHMLLNVALESLYVDGVSDSAGHVDYCIHGESMFVFIVPFLLKRYCLGVVEEVGSKIVLVVDTTMSTRRVSRPGDGSKDLSRNAHGGNVDGARDGAEEQRQGRVEWEVAILVVAEEAAGADAGAGVCVCVEEASYTAPDKEARRFEHLGNIETGPVSRGSGSGPVPRFRLALFPG